MASAPKTIFVTLPCVPVSGFMLVSSWEMPQFNQFGNVAVPSLRLIASNVQFNRKDIVETSLRKISNQLQKS
jgi:hypothetical protein